MTADEWVRDQLAKVTAERDRAQETLSATVEAVAVVVAALKTLTRGADEPTTASRGRVDVVAERDRYEDALLAIWASWQAWAGLRGPGEYDTVIEMGHIARDALGVTK